MPDCVFCNIVNHVIDRKILFEDGQVAVIDDILPKAPVHMLVISKEHIPSVSRLEDKHRALIADMIFAAKSMSEKRGIAEGGYKLAFNVGKDGGQVIPHLHLHVLGGKKFSE